jgi:exonuclease III
MDAINSLIKMQCWANCNKKEYLTVCCFQEIHLIDRNKHWLRVKGWKKIYQVNGSWKQAGVAILILEKVDFSLTLVKEDKEGLFLLIKLAVYQKEITIINLYSPNVTASNFIKHTLKNLKAQHSGSRRV